MRYSKPLETVGLVVLVVGAVLAVLLHNRASAKPQPTATATAVVSNGPAVVLGPINRQRIVDGDEPSVVTTFNGPFNLKASNQLKAGATVAVVMTDVLAQREFVYVIADGRPACHHQGRRPHGPVRLCALRAGATAWISLAEIQLGNVVPDGVATIRLPATNGGGLTVRRTVNLYRSYDMVDGVLRPGARVSVLDADDIDGTLAVVITDPAGPGSVGKHTVGWLPGVAIGESWCGVVLQRGVDSSGPSCR